MILLVGLSAILMMGGRLADFMANLAKRQLGDGAWLSTDVGVFCHQTRDVLTGLGTALLPIFGVVWLAAVGITSCRSALSSRRLKRLPT